MIRSVFGRGGVESGSAAQDGMEATVMIMRWIIVKTGPDESDVGLFVIGMTVQETPNPKFILLWPDTTGAIDEQPARPQIGGSIVQDRILKLNERGQRLGILCIPGFRSSRQNATVAAGNIHENPIKRRRLDLRNLA